MSGRSAPERMTVEQGRKLLAKSDEQPEAVVITQARQYLRTLGWYVIRIQQGIGCHRGLTDLICVKDSLVVFLECKATKGKMSEHQEKFRSEILRRGGIYWLVHSLDELIGFLRLLERDETGA